MTELILGPLQGAIFVVVALSEGAIWVSHLGHLAATVVFVPGAIAARIDQPLETDPAVVVAGCFGWVIVPICRSGVAGESADQVARAR